jgi:glycosyltransferase involved in cell wall biosynthesis
MPKIAVITPAYNAEKSLKSVFSRIPDDILEIISHFIIVNDGSTDQTGEVISQLQQLYPNLVALTHVKNLGYGAAEKTLLNKALEMDVEYVIMLHADGQYSPEKMPAILKPFFDNQADMVQGSRMLEGGALQGGMPYYKYLSNKTLTFLENRVLGMQMAEFHSGYMAYSRRVMENVPYNKLSDSFVFDLEMLVMSKVKKLSLKEVAIPTIYADEVSYLNPIKYGLDVLAVLKRFSRGYYHQL